MEPPIGRASRLRISSVDEALTAVRAGPRLGLFSAMRAGRGDRRRLIAEIARVLPPASPPFSPCAADATPSSASTHCAGEHAATRAAVARVYPVLRASAGGCAGAGDPRSRRRIGSRGAEVRRRRAILLDSATPPPRKDRAGRRVHDWELSLRIREAVVRCRYLAGACARQRRGRRRARRPLRSMLCAPSSAPTGGSNPRSRRAVRPLLRLHPETRHHSPAAPQRAERVASPSSPRPPASVAWLNVPPLLGSAAGTVLVERTAGIERLCSGCDRRSAR